MSINYYEVMGIPSNHPQENIPQAFRNKAKQIHPDKCKVGENINANK
jgi:curved DNA-binding protein CbpA